MGFIKFIFQNDTLIVNASRNFESLEKFYNFFKKEIELLAIIGNWSPIAVDLDTGEYESALTSKRMNNSDIEDYLLSHGYKYVNNVLTKRISVTHVRRNNRNYSRRS